MLENILGVPASRVDATFGHLLESLGSGCPPHAGFALGVDRCVLRLPSVNTCLANMTSCLLTSVACVPPSLISLAVGPERARSIRDVIAFPKSHAGTEMLSGAPSAVSEQVLEEFGLRNLSPVGQRTNEDKSSVHSANAGLDVHGG